ncbi:hypothetical protein SSS_09610 [Sarcoptes scabiei]|uniref:Uncharacterized protein n=1 Tax=Sarcoptes scabiei TaxID=52283 RepID=A0A834RFZ9_SARSC|nr:hypothetical protein SSS_09610 [Sarcoptes scabiei]UXI16376.1 immediate early response 3-interacting protein 1 [Sarcoptes scabiei]
MFLIFLLIALLGETFSMPYGTHMILGGYGGRSSHGGYGYVVPAAVLSHHNIKYYDVPSKGYIKPTTIDVPPNYIPVHFIFRSASSLVNVEQKHMGAKGDYKESYSKDEPHFLKHTVTKPIIQEVHEIISPYRKVVQTVEPVKEEIKTLVARGYGHHGKEHYGSHDLYENQMIDVGNSGYGHGSGFSMGYAA